MVRVSFTPLPGNKPFVYRLLAGVMAAKFGQTKELLLNLGKQKGYVINAKPPTWPRAFLISFLIIAD
jgi:hypothetical protein